MSTSLRGLFSVPLQLLGAISGAVLPLAFRILCCREEGQCQEGKQPHGGDGRAHKVSRKERKDEKILVEAAKNSLHH
eukprot:1162051-Pelagomonas_calceolata.AAC.6